MSKPEVAPAFYIHPSDLAKLSNNATSSRTVTAYRAHPEFERERAGCVPVYSEPLSELTESSPVRLRRKLADSMRREIGLEYRMADLAAERNELLRLLLGARVFMDQDPDFISCQRGVVDICACHSCTARRIDATLAKLGKGGES